MMPAYLRLKKVRRAPKFLQLTSYFLLVQRRRSQVGIKIRFLRTDRLEITTQLKRPTKTYGLKLKTVITCILFPVKMELILNLNSFRLVRIQ